MARLVLSLDGQVMAEYNMNKERYTIGRLPDNDIRIDNAAVNDLRRVGTTWTAAALNQGPRSGHDDALAW